MAFVLVLGLQALWFLWGGTQTPHLEPQPFPLTPNPGAGPQLVLCPPRTPSPLTTPLQPWLQSPLATADFPAHAPQAPGGAMMLCTPTTAHMAQEATLRIF